MGKKSVITIQDRFASQFDANLNKFSPNVLHGKNGLIEKIETHRANVDILEELFGRKVRNVWVSRNGQIAETIDDSDKLITKVLVKGKGAGNEVPLWQYVKTLNAIQENDSAVERLQGWIDEVKAIGTDESVKATRKGRTSAYPNAVTVKFVPTVSRVDSLDANTNAYAVYVLNPDGQYTIAGYNVEPKKRATK